MKFLVNGIIFVAV